MGVSSETNLPTRWSATENVIWRAPLSGVGASTPVVWGERVFLTASDGRLNDHLHVYCFDRKDGRKLWHVRLFGSALSDGQYAAGGMAVPTPVTDGKHLYALFGTGELVCLDVEGKPVWIRSLAQEYGPFRNRWGMAASPVLLDGLLVVQVDHWSQSYLLGVDAATGANRWRTPRDASVNWSSPIVAVVKGKPQILATGTFKVQGYDPLDGSELWAVDGMQMQCIPTPVVQGEVAYAVSGYGGDCVAIRLDGSRGNVTGTNVVWKRKKPTMPFITSPVCYRGRCYLVNDGSGIGICLDAATGAEVWHERLGGDHKASPVAGDGKIYFANSEGVVAVVKAGPKFELLAKNRLGEGIVAEPAISQGQIFLRGQKHLYCVGETRDQESGIRNQGKK